MMVIIVMKDDEDAANNNDDEDDDDDDDVYDANSATMEDRTALTVDLKDLNNYEINI